MVTIQNQSGFLALIVVILVGSFLVVATTSIGLLQSDEVIAASNWLSEVKSQGRIKACVDSTLAILRNNTSATGNVNIAAANVPCVSTISGSGNTRTIISRATTTDAYSRNAPLGVNVNVNINTNPFTVISYKDILE